MIWTTTFRENKQMLFNQHEQSLTWIQKDEGSTFQGGVSSLFFLCTVELFNNPTKKHSSRYSIPMKNGNATLHWQTKLGAKNRLKTSFNPPSSLSKGKIYSLTKKVNMWNVNFIELDQIWAGNSTQLFFLSKPETWSLLTFLFAPPCRQPRSMVHHFLQAEHTFRRIAFRVRKSCLHFRVSGTQLSGKTFFGVLFFWVNLWNFQI